MHDRRKPVQSRVWQWRRAIGETNLPPTTRQILHALSEFMDSDGTSCFPTVSDLARRTGRDRGTVSDHLKIAELAGWIRVETGSFGGQKWRRQSYVARWPDAVAQARGEAEKVAGVGGEAGGVDPHKVGASCLQDNTSPKTSPNTTPQKDAGGRALSRFDRKGINRAFLRWLPTWPSYDRHSDMAARQAWYGLDDAERHACIRLTPAYLTRLGKEAIKSPAVYLRERAWQVVSEAEAFAAPEKIEAKAFGPLWMATRFKLLLQPPTGTVIFTQFDRGLIAAGMKTEDQIRLEKLPNCGWPAVNSMMQDMRHGVPYLCPSVLQALIDRFRSVKKDGPIYEAWARLHKQRGWPWFDFAPAYISMPMIDVEAADLDAAVDAAMTDFAMGLEGLK